jgi:hypothetical protein
LPGSCVRCAHVLSYNPAAMPQRRFDLLADQRDRPPFGHRQFTAGDPPVRAGITGTGDDMLLLCWSKGDLSREVAAGVRVLGRLGVHAGARVGNTLPGALATPGALLLGDVTEAIGALDVPLGVIESESMARAAWELADRVQCEILVLDPVTAATLFLAAPGVERPWWSGIVWLERGEGHPRPAPPDGFVGWQRTWLAVPEVASFAGGTCERGRMHADTAVAVDVVDGRLVLAADGAAAPGAFDTGMTARLVDCACAASGAALELVCEPSSSRAPRTSL